MRHNPTLNSEYLAADAIVVGSGPGGATVARALAQAGRRVLILERGRDERRRPDYGTYLGALRYAERGSFLFTREGLNLVRPIMLGGATSMYCGCAAGPPSWLKDGYGIDLSAEVAETVAELEIAPLPATLRGPASTRLAEAGRALGMDWHPEAKFMRPARSARFGCGAHCMLGCRCGAKWNAAEYVDEALEAGASLITGARAERVLVEGGRAVGVSGRANGRAFVARAPLVVLAAGGLGTPLILRASGYEQAGIGLTVDTTTIVYGVTEGSGNGQEPPMTWYWRDDDAGYMLSTLVDPWLLYPIVTLLSGWPGPRDWPRWGRTLGVMIKLSDDLAGGLCPDGTISKPLTDNDQRRLVHARAAARRLLLAAGAAPDSIRATVLRGTHPGSTARIGALVDETLQTATPGLYVCDASVFPAALGRPTVLTIIGLAKRLARTLIERQP
ncbi:MAG TPA: GMC family oxidoreductase N-terminal domain-containing protein [Roseiflexaceae bacterium]|nr:GMC family oxidoreductase N-terminal domain-containing protein [Roseiflexaceae bacterium]